MTTPIESQAKEWKEITPVVAKPVEDDSAAHHKYLYSSHGLGVGVENPEGTNYTSLSPVTSEALSIQTRNNEPLLDFSGEGIFVSVF